MAIVYFKCCYSTPNKILFDQHTGDEISGTESVMFLRDPGVGEIEPAIVQHVGTEMHKNKKGSSWCTVLSLHPRGAGPKEDGLLLSEMPCPLSLGSHAAPVASPWCQDSFSASIITERGGIIPPQPRVTLHHERPRGLLIRLPLSNAIRDAKSRSLVMRRCWGLREKILRVPPQHFLL